MPEDKDVIPTVEPQAVPQDPMANIYKSAQKGYDIMVQKGYKPEQAKQSAEGFIKKQRILQGFTSPITEVSTTVPEVHQESNPVSEFAKSAWNGFGPSVLKLIPDVVSMGTNFIGLHSDTIDSVTEDWDKFIDKYTKAYIDPEHEKGIFQTDESGSTDFTNWRSVVNGLGNGLGTVAQFVALTFATGGVGDVAEAADAVKVATAAGDAEGLVKATTDLKSAQMRITATKAASGSLLFAPQIYEDAKKAGLTHQYASRLAIALSIPLGLLGTIGGAEQKALEKYLAGEAVSGTEEAVINKLGDKGVLKGLEGFPKGRAMTAKEFETTMKASISDAASMSKKIINQGVAKTAGKEFAQMYLQSAVQTFGEQMYDKMYGGDSEVGKGKFGAQEFVDENDPNGIGPSLFGYKVGKKAAMNDLTSGIYGGIIGSLMSAYSTPIVNQSIYGYIDGKIRDGKSAEGVGKVKTMADILLKKNKLSQEQYDNLVGTPEVPAQPAKEGSFAVEGRPAKKGLIDQMAETSEALKAVNGEKLDPVASYDVYNFQNNVKPVLESSVSKYEAQVGELAKAMKENPNDTVMISALQAIVSDGYDSYKNNVEKHQEINKHISEVTSTGKTKNIQPTLDRISEQKHSYADDEQIAPLMQNFDREARIKSKEGPLNKTGAKYKDLVGQDVIHTPTGRKGTIITKDNSLPNEEPQFEHYFHPHADEPNRESHLVGEGHGGDLVDESKYKHTIPSSQIEANATKEGKLQEDNIAQHQAGNQGGETTETSGSNRTEQSGEVKQEKIKTIVDKIHNGEELSPEDNQMYSDNMPEIMKAVIDKYVSEKETPQQKEALAKEIDANIPDVEADPIETDAYWDLANEIDALPKSEKEASTEKKDTRTPIQQLTSAEPETFEQSVLQYFLGLNKNFKHAGKLEYDEQARKDTGYAQKDSIQGELQDSDEYKSRRWMFHKTGENESKVTTSIPDLATALMRQWEDAGHAPIDETTATNTVLSVIHDYEKQSDMVNRLRADFGDAKGNIIGDMQSRAEARIADEQAKDAEAKAKWEAEHPEEVKKQKEAESQKELSKLDPPKDSDINCPF